MMVPLISRFLPFLLYTVVFFISIIQCSQDVCKVPWKRTKHGDFTIAALFPLHLYNSATLQYELNHQAVVWAEAFIFAIDAVNKDGTLLRNKTIGFKIYDTCNIESLAQESVLDVMLNAGTRNVVKTTLGRPCTCRRSDDSMVVSFIGGASSKISSIVSTLLGVDLIPQLSYSSTSIDLSNKRNYPSFLRTIPPDNFQAEFIVDILEHYGWKYINVLASDDSYGRDGVDFLLPLLRNSGKCVAVLVIFNTQLSPGKFDNMVKVLKDEQSANVTVLWSGKTAARAVIDAAVRISLHGKTWIATEGWGGDENILNKDPRVVKGILGVIPLMKFYEPFEKYILGKAVQDLQIYKMIYNVTSCKENTSCRRITKDLEQFKNHSTILRIKIPNVVDAVYSVANSLNEISNENFSYETLLSVMGKLEFKGPTGITVHFNQNGDPSTAAYSLVNTRLAQDGSIGFQIVGEWNSESRNISFIRDIEVQFAGNSNKVPLSRCAEECGPGYYAFMEKNRKCCWKCLKCREDTFKEKNGNGQCTKCEELTISNENRTSCVQLQQVYLHINSIHGIIIATISVLGATASFAGATIFLLFRDTPLVRSSNRELSILQLVISAFEFLYPLLYTVKPNLFICYARPLVFGVLFSISNSIVFTKVDRLLRIFKLKYRPKRRGVIIMLSNKFQLLIVFSMASLAGLICMMSFVHFPPLLVKEIDRKKLSLEIRCENVTFATNILVAYMGVISITCIVYTIKAKDLPRQFRESRYIGLGMFVATLVWFFYLPLSLSERLNELRDFAFTLAVCISNASLLFVIYWSKTWRILLHPEENNAATFRGQLATRVVPVLQIQTINCMKAANEKSKISTEIHLEAGPKTHQTSSE